MKTSASSLGRLRARGLVALAAIVLGGLIAPGYFHWKAPEIRARRHATEDAVASAATSAEGRLADWTRFGAAQVHNRLQQMRFSAEQPWLVTHAIGSPSERPDLEFHGIDLADMPQDLLAIEGLSVVLRLPAPVPLGRGALRGNHATFIPVFADRADARDAVARAREIVGWALDALGRALGRDIPGAVLEVEIGPETSWGAIRARRSATSPEAGAAR